MKTNKINALEAVIAALEISENELTNWFNNRGKDKTGLIPTELPLVYRRGNELTVENGLNLSRKSELWGIQLLSGVMVALPLITRETVEELTPASFATSWMVTATPFTSLSVQPFA